MSPELCKLWVGTQGRDGCTALAGQPAPVAILRGLLSLFPAVYWTPACWQCDMRCDIARKIPAGLSWSCQNYWPDSQPVPHGSVWVDHRQDQPDGNDIEKRLIFRVMSLGGKGKVVCGQCLWRENQLWKHLFISSNRDAFSWTQDISLMLIKSKGKTQNQYEQIKTGTIDFPV